MTVDKNSNLPMHQQLYLILKEKIEKERERCVVEVSLWRGALVLLEQKIA